MLLLDYFFTSVEDGLDPNDVYRFGFKWANKYLIYSDKNIRDEIKNNKDYSHIKNHLDNYNDFITSSNKPFGLHRPRELRYFINPKIIFKGMFVNNEFAFDDKKYFVGFSFSLIIQKDKNYDLKYILSILNSGFALDWFYKNGKKRGAGVDIGVEKLRLFPIKIANTDDQKPFTEIVDQILAAKKKDPNADTSALERQIDKMVYALYDLTPEEIAIVEGKK